MTVYGLRPEDVVVDAAGNVQTGATLTLHANQADAQAGTNALTTVTTSAGRWSADLTNPSVWVRTPNGAVYQIQDFAAKADKTYVDTQLSGKLDQATANSTFADYASLARTPDALITGTVTRDANGAATSAPVTWPDGTPGTYTALTLSADYPGAVDSYQITYGSPVTRTYTQPLITRDSNGAAVGVPAITEA